MSKILIIEDELSIAELERDYLELNDFEVEIETNGLNGLEKALSEEYSLILLDLMLPDMDGFEICRQIREKKDGPGSHEGHIKWPSARAESTKISTRPLGPELW